jgi:hypothetical protein
MFSFNRATGSEDLWKVLIYDRLGQDVISPLLKVNELRECGITVHMPIERDRYPISDVPAIYFVTPNIENLQRIALVMIITNYRIWKRSYMNLII